MVFNKNFHIDYYNSFRLLDVLSDFIYEILNNLSTWQLIYLFNFKIVDYQLIGEFENEKMVMHLGNQEIDRRFLIEISDSMVREINFIKLIKFFKIGVFEKYLIIDGKNIVIYANIDIPFTLINK